MKYFFYLVAVFLLISVVYSDPCHSQQQTMTYLFDPGSNPAEKLVNITHLTAHISVDPYKQLVQGQAAFTFRTVRDRTDSIVFNVPDITASEIQIDNKQVRFTNEGNSLVIYPVIETGSGKQHEVTISYTASSPSYLYHSGWDDPAGIKRKQIWAHRPVSWLPFTDARLTVDMFVTFDKNYKVFSNGERIEVNPKGDSLLTWHYRMNRPHPFFSTALVIGDYKYSSFKADNGLPLEMWYYPDQEDRVPTTYMYMPEMISFFEREMGLPYPWELYRQAPVVDYLYGAMETTTSTVFGDYMFVDERAFSGRNYVNVNAHELAHQWFGNYISHLAPKDVWLTESFATYYAKIFEKSVFGEDYYENERNNEFIETFEASSKDNYATGHSHGGRARWYPKGSLILDMLRDVMGDDNFKTAIRYYLETRPYRDARTSDFIDAVYYSTGLNLDWFFDEWIKRPGEPEFEITYQRVLNADAKDVTQVTVKQVHTVTGLTGYFRMPVWIEIYYSDGSSARQKVWLDGQQTICEILNTTWKDISFVLFDPGRRILKKVKFSKSFEELSEQVLRAPLMIDRYDALTELSKVPLEKKKDVLIQCLKKEHFRLTKSEIIKQLAPDTTALVIEMMKNAISDSDVYVRRAVLQNIRTVPSELKMDYEKLLSDISYINVELALQNLCPSFPEDRNTYLDATKTETGWRGRNIRVKWLEIAIENGQNEYLKELIGYTGKSYEFETRQNALNALRRLDYLDQESAGNLLDSYLYWNFKLSNTAKEVLSFFMQENKTRAVINGVYKSRKWSEEEKTRLSEVMEKGSKF
jgi:aminopeptidase N